MDQDLLSDGQVTLRRLTLRDAPTVRLLAGDPAVADTTLHIPHPYPDGEAEQWIATHAGEFEQGTGAIFAITAGKFLELVGCIGISVSREHAQGEIGYWIGRPFWGKGHATAALRLLLRYSFSELNLHRVHAHHFARNPASGRVLQKAGLLREGLLREHVRKHGHYEDVVLYGLLRADYQSRDVRET